MSERRIANQLRRTIILGLILALATFFVLPATAFAVTETWSVIPSPSPGNEGNVLNDVSCSDANDCMAVGYYQSNSTYESLAEVWNGSDWTVTPSPNPTVQDTLLNGVSCTSPTMCVAVGYAAAGNVALTELWNGTGWTVLSSIGVEGQLYGVSCTSAASCAAVGVQYHPSQSLVATWDGTSWTVTPSPNPGDSTAELHGVSCTDATHCLAVGAGGTNPESTIAEAWNGTTWTTLSSTNPGSELNSLVRVTCVTWTNCLAVGGYSSTSTSSLTKSLVEFWNGSSWSDLLSPSPGSSQNALQGVSCVDASDCIAVGASLSSQNSLSALVESWDGSAWAVESDANPVDANLTGVSCTAPMDCTAVGHNAQGQTVIEMSTTNPGIGLPETPVVVVMLPLIAGAGFALSRVGRTLRRRGGNGVREPRGSEPGDSWITSVRPPP
jgi:hypothetical protein